MIWRWLISFSVCISAGMGLCPGLALGASVSGEVELTNSKNLSARRHKDYAGVVLWLEPVDRAAPPLPLLSAPASAIPPW